MYAVVVPLVFIITGILFWRLCLTHGVFIQSLSSPLRFLFVLTSAVAVTSGCVQWIVPSRQENVLLVSLFSGALVISASLWFYFCLGLLLKNKRARRGWRFLLILTAALVCVMIFTNGFHKLLWRTAPFAGQGLYVVLGYALALMYAGFFIYAGRLSGQALFLSDLRIAPAVIIGLPLLLYLGGVFFFHFESFIGFFYLHCMWVVLLVFYITIFRYPFGEFIAHQEFFYRMGDPLIITNNKQQLIFLNPRMYSLLEKDEGSVIGKDFAVVFPGLSFLSEALSRFSPHREAVLLGSVTYDLIMLPVTNLLGKQKAKICIFHDISQLEVTDKNLKKLHKLVEQEVVSRVRDLKNINEVLKESNQALIDEIAQRRKAERMINSALDEKNILIGEIHHRVKNNLQIIISLLNLQKRYFNDERIRDVFRTTVNRIRSIGMIHEKLYKAQDLSNTDIAEYINDLSHYLFHSFTDKANSIMLRVDVEKIYLDLNRSILCGLIINELVSNSMKHAFNGAMKRKAEKNNEIMIKLEAKEEDLVLIVKDNGRGIPQNIDIANVESLGMKIITTLVKQLKGKLEIKSDRGMEVRITFAKETPFGNIQAEQQDMLLRIQNALSELPKKVRETTILYYLDGKSINEVSQTLGVSVENVQSQLQVARKHLKELLTKSVS